MNMDERLLSYLNDKAKINESNEFQNTHQQIAYDLHTSRTVVSQLLKALENEDKISLHRTSNCFNGSIFDDFHESGWVAHTYQNELCILKRVNPFLISCSFLIKLSITIGFWRPLKKSFLGLIVNKKE